MILGGPALCLPPPGSARASLLPSGEVFLLPLLGWESRVSIGDLSYNMVRIKDKAWALPRGFHTCDQARDTIAEMLSLVLCRSATVCLLPDLRRVLWARFRKPFPNSKDKPFSFFLSSTPGWMDTSEPRGAGNRAWQWEEGSGGGPGVIAECLREELLCQSLGPPW